MPAAPPLIYNSIVLLPFFLFGPSLFVRAGECAQKPRLAHIFWRETESGREGGREREMGGEKEWEGRRESDGEAFCNTAATCVNIPCHMHILANAQFV